MVVFKSFQWDYLTNRVVFGKIKGKNKKGLAYS